MPRRRLRGDRSLAREAEPRLRTITVELRRAQLDDLQRGLDGEGASRAERRADRPRTTTFDAADEAQPQTAGH